MKKPDYDKDQKQFWLGLSIIVGFFVFVHLLGGCATAKSVKREIAIDLREAVKYGDCPFLCDYLKTYLETKLK